MRNYCPIHKINLTPSFDVSNMFCYKCETENASNPVKSDTGFNVTAAPVGPTTKFTYYAVLDNHQPNKTPQFERLFRTTTKVKKELDNRIKSFFNVTKFISVKVVSETKCVHWFPSGMSRDTYAIWNKGNKPKTTNGNHVEVVDIIKNNLKKKSKLRTKYGGSMKPLPTKSQPPVPTSANVVPKAPTTKQAQKPKKTKLKKSPKKTKLKKYP